MSDFGISNEYVPYGTHHNQNKTTQSITDAAVYGQWSIDHPNLYWFCRKTNFGDIFLGISFEVVRLFIKISSNN